MDAAAVSRHGKSLLNEALSPSSRHLVQDYYSAADPHESLGSNNASDDEQAAGNHSADRRSLPGSTASTSFFDERRSLPGKPPRAGHKLKKLVSTAVFTPENGSRSSGNRTFVQIECDHRPFCLQLSLNARAEIVVAGFVADPTNGGRKGTVERTGLIQVGDVLVAVNDEMDALSGSIEAAAKAMMQAELPATLTFRRVPLVKSTLGEYSLEQIARNLELFECKLSQIHGVQDAASIVKACIDVQNDNKSVTPLTHYVQRVEKLLYPSSGSGELSLGQRRLEELRVWMDKIHQHVDQQAKEQHKKWNAAKPSNYKRIEMMSKQRDSIRKRLEKMQSTPDLLRPDNNGIWQEFIELRHLASQLTHSVEQAKRDHFLPEFEGYALRFGSEGVYVGLGDLWVALFHAKFTIETRSRAPHVVFHLSTPSTTGLKLRCTGVKLATEGRLPSFQCDELNIEAQLVADVPFVYDEVSGWSVPQDELFVKLQSFSYYERRSCSTKRGADHDTVIKLFINRLLPSVVRQAAQNLFCEEMGPLLASRNAQLVLTGEVKIEGRPLKLYDAPLNSAKTGGGANGSAADAEMTEELRRLIGLGEEEADAMCRIFKSVETSFKKRGFVTNEHSNMSLRVVSHYFEQFKAFPHIKVLLSELWNQSLQLVMTGSAASDSTDSFASTLITNVEQLQQYPVDVSMTLSEVTLRLDLCEGAATYYTVLQRLLRHRMNSVSVGLANIDALKDGTYFENELTALDEWYDKVTRTLSYVTTNVDDLGVILRGGIPAGFRSNMTLEAHKLACKGPCTGSFTIPLTDLANIRLPDTSAATDSFSALLHERNALVFSKYFLDLDSEEGAAHSHEHGGGIVDGTGRVIELPQDRVSVSVKNTSARVLFELPSDLSTLTPGSSFAPFSISLSAENGEAPKLRFETGEFAKCQYKAEQIKLSGSMWRLLKKSKNAVDATVDAPASTSAEGKSVDAREDESVWTEYLDSPFFTCKFHFLTSCQVTRDHIFWSLKSASLSHPNVVRVRHRISLVELLQDIGMASLVDSDGDKSQADRLAKRRQDARFRRALFNKLGNNNREDDGKSMGGRETLNFSTLSAHDAMFSRNSFAGTAEDDGFERLSEGFEPSEHSEDANDRKDLEPSEDNNNADEADDRSHAEESTAQGESDDDAGFESIPAATRRSPVSTQDNASMSRVSMDKQSSVFF